MCVLHLSLLLIIHLLTFFPGKQITTSKIEMVLEMTSKYVQL